VDRADADLRRTIRKFFITAARCCLKSTDEGMHWDAISPDLTRNDKAIAGGRGRADRPGRHRDGILRRDFTPSRNRPSEGTDLGRTDDETGALTREEARLVERDAEDLPGWSRISIIDASRMTRRHGVRRGKSYQLDDLHPYIYRLPIRQTWTKITDASRKTFRARGARRSEAQGAALCRTEIGCFCFVRRWGKWAAVQSESAGPTRCTTWVVQGEDCAGDARAGIWILDDWRRCGSSTTRFSTARCTFIIRRRSLRTYGGGRGGGGRGGAATTGENPPPADDHFSTT